jgi:hypothetical protein
LIFLSLFLLISFLYAISSREADRI